MDHRDFWGNSSKMASLKAKVIWLLHLDGFWESKVRKTLLLLAVLKIFFFYCHVIKLDFIGHFVVYKIHEPSNRLPQPLLHKILNKRARSNTTRLMLECVPAHVHFLLSMCNNCHMPELNKHIFFSRLYNSYFIQPWNILIHSSQVFCLCTCLYSTSDWNT